MEAPLCSKCQVPLEKGLAGTYSAICGGCKYLNTGFEKGEWESSRGVDITKLSPTDVEYVANAGGAGAHKMKKAAFGKYLDEISSEIKNTSDPERRGKLEEIRRKQVIPYYNKYHGTNIRN